MHFGPVAKRLADKQTYPIIEEKEQAALGRIEPFSIEPKTTTLTQTVLTQASEAIPGGSTAGDEQSTTGGLTISLADALELAVDNNWDWQRRKEDLYLSALTLTEARHAFDPIFSGGATGSATRQPGTGGGVERFGEVTGDLSATQQVLATGARISVGLSNNLLRSFTHHGADSANGALAASIVQPLLRGAGALVVGENLTQAERNVIYAVRDFSRFRKGFIINIFSGYFRLLQTRDVIDNEWSAYQRLIFVRERAEAMEQAERMAAFEVDQARQDEFNARGRWIAAKAAYINALNQYKVSLGLPTETNIQPDPAELQAISKAGLIAVSYSLPRAEQESLGARLDYQTALNAKADAERKVVVAENGLLPDLNASGNYSVASSNHNQPLDLQGGTRRYSGSLDLELPLDRLQERNDYRRALINLERSRRDAEQLRANVLVEVRKAYQDIQEARQTYEIQRASLELALKRVDNVQMLMDAGLPGITIRDQLEAQSALRDAQNSVTRSLVDYTIARLQFYNSIEALEIDERGMWHETEKTKS